MATSISLEGLLSVVHPAALDRPCSDDHLMELALGLINWKEMAYFLRLSETEIEEVEAGVRAELVRAKNLRMLRKWKAKYGKQATYRCLSTVLWKLGKVSVIEELTQMLQAPATTPQAVPEPVSEECTVYADYLKVRYGLNMPGCALQLPRPPTHMYFDLALIEREEREKSSVDKELASLAVEGRVREMMEKRTPVKLEDLFKHDRKQRKVILIEGPPGSGKTTLSWHLCQKWKQGEPFPGFELVIYVQLRDPAVLSARSIADLLPRRNDEMAREVLADMEARDGEGVLFVLDGWDELPGDLPRDSPLRQLIEPSVLTPFQRSSVIITTRPEESAELHNLASSRVQILGFTPEKVEEYFTESLKNDPEQAKILVERVKENPGVEGSCSLPLNAAIIVTLFLHMGHQLPSTLTGIFVALVLHCILRHCKARTNLRIRSLFSLDSIPGELQKSFDSLCMLAYQGVLVNQILFTEQDVGVLPEFATLSLLQAVESFVTVGSVKMYNFLHLSIQELLAAWYISRMPADAQLEVMRRLRGHERFAGVFRFYAGLTHLRVPWNKDFIKLMIIRSQAEWELLLESLHEVQDPSLYRFVGDELQHEQQQLNFYSKLSPIACHSLGYLLPLLSPANVTLGLLDEQCTILLVKGLQKGWSNHHKPKGGLVIDIEHISSLYTQGGVQAITQLLSVCGVEQLVLALSVHAPITWQLMLKCIAKELTCNFSVKSFRICAVPNYIQSADEINTALSGTGLYEMLTSNRTLKTLNLGFAHVHIDVSSIAKGLMHNSTLEHLHLRGCEITDDEAKSLASMLARNTTLRTLNLSWNRITDVGAWFLADVLTENRSSLSVLNLLGNRITHVCTLSLAEMLKSNTFLISLDLSSNNISSEGMNNLADSLKYNRTLRFLRLDLHVGLEALATALTVNTTVELADSIGLKYWRCQPPPGLARELMANGVLKQLLTIAIERTVSEFGEEWTFVALIALMEEWKAENRNYLRALDYTCTD